MLKYRVPHGSHKVGLAAAKAAALRVNLNVQGCGIVVTPMHADRGSDPNHRGIWNPPMAGLGPVRNPVL